MKQIQHTFNGQEYTLDVGKMWFSKYFGEATKVDPIINISELFTDLSKQYDFIVGLVYGGLNCHNKVTGKEFIKLETVQNWVGAMEQQEAADIINKYAAVAVKQDEGEVNPQL